MQSFEILPTTENDVDYISKTIQHRWGMAPDDATNEARNYLDNDASRAGFCVHHEGKIVGVGLFDVDNSDVSTEYGPWVFLLWVEPEYRGNDLGILISQKRMDHARKHSYTELFLDTKDAEPYHTKLGWEYVKTIKHEGEPDSIIMRYDLAKNFPIESNNHSESRMV